MKTRLITTNVANPVDLADVKTFLGVDGNERDAEIGSFITAAREVCEHIIGRSIMTQTWELVLDEFPCSNDIELFYPPIQSITSVKYIDALTSNETTLLPNQYSLDKDSEPGWLMPAYGVNWPSTLPVANAVRIQYLAGYQDADHVPDSIKNWIKLAVRAMYDGCGKEGLIAVMDQFDCLLDRVKVWCV